MKTLFLGDICPTDCSKQAFKEKNIKALFGNSASIFENKDFIFANMECAVTESEKSIKKFGPPLKAPEELPEVLSTLGVTCVGLSNNHIFDFGKKGVCDTLKALQKNNIDYTGFGNDYESSRKNYIFEKNGEKICIIAVCEHEFSYALSDRMGSRPYDEYDTMEDIRNAKKTADRVIVTYHGGKELCQYPSPRLRRLCQAMAKNGADTVLCQHSHCIGVYEKFDGCNILYGQGNFHFVGFTDHPFWNTGFAVAYDTKTNEMKFIPVSSTKNGIALSEYPEKTLSDFKERSKKLQNNEWLKEWHNFCENSREGYLNAIKNACADSSSEADNALFSHFLDCEAHTDVWRELFPTYNQTNEKGE